ncbi:structural maintenance of chromosomes protein 6 [Pancytospora epiphaga]|nr:structural maintenance of chromosomes protein 6 [Pancytospora epiphaga]
MAALTISSIELSNFMCHRHFLLSFTKRITCIGGRNGTGKSAVMVALGVIFGQRTHALERGNNVASLIRTGTNQAIIRVVINNHKKVSVDRYGMEITIEKRLRASGSKLAVQKDGKLTSMSVQELQTLLDAYGLKFENPLNFLTQEKSKKFLMTAGPEELYDYYYRGSEFKTINEELDESLAIVNEMENKLKGTAEEYERVNVELLEQQENLRFLSTDYESVLKRLEIEEKTIDLRGTIKRIDKCEQENEKKMERENELKMIKAMEEAELKKMQFVAKSTGAVDAKIEKIRLKMRSMENDYAEYKKEKLEIEEAINAIKGRCRLKEYREELSRTSAELSKVDENISILEKRDGELAVKAEEEKIQNKELSDKKYALSKQISFLKANQHDTQSKQLIEQYEKVKAAMKLARFKDEVVGPLCDYITLKDKRWYKPVSIVLKRSLSSFIVFNKQDRQQLNEIFKKLGLSFPVSLLSSRRVISGLKTVENSLLSVLELSNEIVLNQLVMFHNVEQIMLVEKREEAYRIIKNGSVDRNMRAIECAYTMDGDRVRLTNGSLSDYKARDVGKFWFEDNSTRIKSIERALERITISHAAQEELHENGKHLKSAYARKRGLENVGKELEVRISSVADLKENNTEGYEKKLVILNGSIEALKAKIKECDGMLEIENANKREIQEENTEGERALRKKRSECSKKMESISLEMARVETARNGIVCEIQKLSEQAESKFKEVMVDYEDGKEKEDQTSDTETENNRNETSSSEKQVVDENDDFLYPKDAGSTCKRGSKRDSVRRMASELTGTQDKDDGYRGYYNRLPLEIRTYLKSERASGDVLREKKTVRGFIQQKKELRSREAIRKDIRVLTDERDLCRRIRERYEKSTREIIEACTRRFAKRDEIKNKKTLEASELFREFTMRGGYEGELIFDHDKGRLDLRMKVHQSEVAGSKSTLSGGERSFAGVCFLLSLWRSFCCPVKVLDEFDVFMDVINRRVAIRTLFDFFKGSEMQVILITPLSTEELADDDCEIRILSKEE